ncbi:hypothetical protein PAXRUDRAFT_147670 [Paxillus rubicundulus Ve08.2h10]|uniref:DUF6570 domain-containing protein n=1 Tax=Paxillus rubicundulus Ve08.2h10 TaxID=930991 RepID=A0A0D0D667_9AGAM|nr:hypothetical protein PAXRUDRAFT_147670 [Paxillus rubicundulus Ve08.2h10]
MLCPHCRSALLAKKPHQPKNSLANFQYYGRERLDETTSQVFENTSPFDLTLILRAWALTVTFHYNTHSSRGGYTPEETHQRYNCGNVAVLPQEPGQLRKVLPPSRNDICNTICVLFTSGRVKPTVEVLKKSQPVLVTKSRVEKMIKFLLTNNEWYMGGDTVNSEETMADLFGPEFDGMNEGVLHHMEISHLPDNGQQHDQGDGDHAPEHPSEFLHNFVMDNIAYTSGDHSAKSQELMKAHVLTFVLDRKHFLTSRASAQDISDGDTGLMSYLFPHLCPWGIGGFNHPACSRGQTLLFEQQVKNLLLQDNSAFERDPYFAFICWNMIQKRQVSINTTGSFPGTRDKHISGCVKQWGVHLT